MTVLAWIVAACVVAFFVGSFCAMWMDVSDVVSGLGYVLVMGSLWVGIPAALLLVIVVLFGGISIEVSA